MATGSEGDPTSTSQIWAGRILTALPAIALIASGLMKILSLPEVVETFAKLGFPEGSALAIGVLELSCAAIYLFPRTSVLGAILVTGYLGGATVTHLRVEEPFFAPVLLGVIAWGGLYFRDARLRALLPLRR